jgi:hypothetical protein
MSEQKTPNGSNETLQNIITELEIEKLLGVTKDQLDRLRRNNGLPFVKINNRSRLYFESDLMEFFRSRKVCLNHAEIDH